jgi:hypothetical protein
LCEVESSSESDIVTTFFDFAAVELLEKAAEIPGCFESI